MLSIKNEYATQNRCTSCGAHLEPDEYNELSCPNQCETEELSGMHFVSEEEVESCSQ